MESQTLTNIRLAILKNVHSKFKEKYKDENEYTYRILSDLPLAFEFDSEAYVIYKNQIWYYSSLVEQLLENSNRPIHRDSTFSILCRDGIMKQESKEFFKFSAQIFEDMEKVHAKRQPSDDRFRDPFAESSEE